MRLSCLVNNYNYGHFLAEAVQSAFAQTVAFDEVIVVDDGSDDHSSSVLASLQARYAKLQVIHKQNGGQLSAFNAGFAESTGDVVYFLDADDVYEPTYVERTSALLSRRPDIEYLYCGRRLFGLVDRIDRPFDGDIDLGYSCGLLAAGGGWLGGSTSCVAMRRQVLSRLLPAAEIEPVWKINADLCLAYGASLAGVRKFCRPEPLVRYRVHGGNSYFGKTEGAVEKYLRRMHSQTLAGYYLHRFGLDQTRLAGLLHLEFATIPRPTKTLLKRYLRAALASRLPIWRRASQAAAIWRHYRRSLRSDESAGGVLDLPSAAPEYASHAEAA